MKVFLPFLKVVFIVAMSVSFSMLARAQEIPDWQSYALTDVQTGETFTLGEFQGKTVFVEGMATWCGYCLHQLQSIALIKDQFDPETHVFIALSVDTNASPEELQSYRQKNDFDWRFAIVPTGLLKELARVFGQKFTRPLSHFIIRSDGSFTELGIGLKSTEELNALILKETQP